MRFPDDVPTLTCGDVTLRAHRLADADAVVEQCTDQASVRWTTVPLGYRHDDAVGFVVRSVPEGWETDRAWTFAIETTHPDGRRRFAGSVSLRNEGDRRAELAFGAHPAVRGRGVMTTAVNLLLDWGFAERDLHTVIWLANVGNVASRRVAWKTGFTFGGTLRRWLSHRGEYLDGWSGTLHRDDVRTPTTPWYDVPTIRGNRLVLRPFGEADTARVTEACSDPRTQHRLPFLPNPYTQADARAYVERCADAAIQGRALVWAVADIADEQLLGSLAVSGAGPVSREVGFWTHPSARGRGVMSDAVALAARHAFTDTADGGLGVHRLFLKASVDNDASQHVARLNGFSEIGRERESEALRGGTYGTLLVFELLADDWAGSLP